MKKWMMIPVLAGAVIISGIGIVANAEQSGVVTQKGLLTMDGATAIAVKTVGGHVTKIELDREVTGDVYEVEVQSKGVEYDLDIDAKTGKVMRTEKDDMDNDEKSIIPDGNVITQEAAVEIAMKQAKGTVTDIELDDDDGRKHYEIEIKDGIYEYEFEIDAWTGKVLKFEKDSDDDDNDDD